MYYLYSFSYVLIILVLGKTYILYNSELALLIVLVGLLVSRSYLIAVISDTRDI